ncbi:hypothetical protein T265_02346 [Opisthorchis viverrini]|uniref:Uncharacterized protein n=1 Tax=Opisthorchis viverrini TaxID=6198 RepID=A0A075AID4_OPIVI|nr:hypothetical protein T265_02346 [Opisthorchis viverrini]KER31439.1 hypothetical protein T265_02346 [Opisthorchis viverrini]
MKSGSALVTYYPAALASFIASVSSSTSIGPGMKIRMKPKYVSIGEQMRASKLVDYLGNISVTWGTTVGQKQELNELNMQCEQEITEIQ